MNILEIKTESPSASNETTVTSNDEKTDISKKDLSKSYRAKISSWHCETCDIYCNSPSQFDVHMISQKHKLMLEDLHDEKLKIKDEPLDFKDFSLDENNESKNVITEQVSLRSRANFSIEEIAQNPLAIKYNINAVKYLITDDKKLGKFEKFGFYCKTCDAYMTGQIQLIMHVRGAKHQFYFPDEIPDYKPNKVYNPLLRKIYNRSLNSTQSDSRSLNSSKEQVAAQISRFDLYGKNVDSPYPMQYIPSQQDSPVFSNNNNQNPYNFSQNAFYKIHPLFTYQMMLNQRLKHNQLDNSVKHGADFSGMGQQQPQQFRVNSFQPEQIPYNNHYEQSYIHHQYNQANLMNPYSTPVQPQFNSSKYNVNATMQSLLKFDHGQSPIAYMLPQNSTPPSSFNQTPMHMQAPRCKKNLLREESKIFNAFNTPPSVGSFSYYNQSNNNIHRQF